MTDKTFIRLSSGSGFKVSGSGFGVPGLGFNSLFKLWKVESQGEHRTLNREP